MKYLPGTKIASEEITPNSAEILLNNVFLCGGLTLSQVATLCDIELYTVQNWVHRGFVSSPVNKKYSRRQFCRLVIINMLKDTLSLQYIAKMLSYINGSLNDESDDTVADDVLYIRFVSLLCSMREDNADKAYEKAEIISDGNERLKKVLAAMYLAYRSSELKKKATEIIGTEIESI